MTKDQLRRQSQSRLIRARDDLNLPLFEFSYHTRAVAVDHADGRAYTVRCGDPSMSRRMQAGGTSWQCGAAYTTASFDRRSYLDAVGRAIEYIRAGDVFQVNLSQRFTAPLTESPAAIYERLQSQSPALYGAYFDFGDAALICNSPELFLRVELDPRTGRRRVTTRPIKGTRASGAGMATQLRDSGKDQAELNMIIDLERNDLGRVCEIGSVHVTEPRVVETHPTVLHTAASRVGPAARTRATGRARQLHAGRSDDQPARQASRMAAAKRASTRLRAAAPNTMSSARAGSSATKPPTISCNASRAW